MPVSTRTAQVVDLFLATPACRAQVLLKSTSFGEGTFETRGLSAQFRRDVSSCKAKQWYHSETYLLCCSGGQMNPTILAGLANINLALHDWEAALHAAEDPAT